MVKFVGGLDKFLTEKYPKEFVLISFGHMELFTEEMQKEYLEWYKNVYVKEKQAFSGGNNNGKTV